MRAPEVLGRDGAGGDCVMNTEQKTTCDPRRRQRAEALNRQRKLQRTVLVVTTIQVAILIRHLPI